MNGFSSKNDFARSDLSWSPWALASFVALARLIPHPANFTPVFAFTLFAARYSPNIFWAIFIPQSALLLSNLVLGFTKSALVTALFNVLISVVARNTKLQNLSRLQFWGLGSLCVPVLFFLVSNFFVWIDSSFFPKNIEGMMTCYTYAIPFAIAPLTSTMLYALCLFELPPLVRSLLSSIGQKKKMR